MRPRVATDEQIAEFQTRHPRIASELDPARIAYNTGLRLKRLKEVAARHVEVEELLYEEVDMSLLRRFAENVVEARFERVPGVSDARVLGGREEELQVIVDPQRLAARRPTWLQAVFNRGQFHAGLERFEQALADYERSVELGAGGSNLRWNQAQALLRLGREQEALDVIDAFLETSPHDSTMLANRAVALFSTGRLDEALATADRTVQAQPAEGWPYIVRAWYAHFGTDRCGQIEDDYRNATRLSQDSADTWSDRAGLMVAYGESACPGLYDTSQAVDLARRAVAFDSGSDYYQQTFGIALYRHGKLEEARDALLRAREIRVNDEPADLFFLAMTSSRLGDRVRARDYYDLGVARMDETFPDNPESRLYKKEASKVLGIR